MDAAVDGPRQGQSIGAPSLALCPISIQWQSVSAPCPPHEHYSCCSSFLLCLSDIMPFSTLCSSLTCLLEGGNSWLTHQNTPTGNIKNKTTDKEMHVFTNTIPSGYTTILKCTCIFFPQSIFSYDFHTAQGTVEKERWFSSGQFAHSFWNSFADYLILYCLVDCMRIVSGTQSQRIRYEWWWNPNWSWRLDRPNGCKGRRWTPREL